MGFVPMSEQAAVEVYRCLEHVDQHKTMGSRCEGGGDTLARCVLNRD